MYEHIREFVGDIKALVDLLNELPEVVRILD